MDVPLRILLVDNDRSSRVLILSKLNQRFPTIQVEQVTDAHGLARALKMGDFCLVITEYQLGWTEGLTVLRSVRAYWPDCPVVMFTSAGAEEAIVKAIKAGVDDYITKSPRNLDRLEAAVWSALEQARQRHLLNKTHSRPADMLEIKPAEERLRTVNRILKMLGEMNYVVAHAADETSLLAEACRLIVQAGGYCLAWIGFAEQDENKTVRPVAHVGYEDNYLDTVRITWADTERGRGPTGTAIRTGRCVVCKNVMTDPNYAPWREEAAQRGYASSIALPIMAGGQTLGALNIYAAEPEAFDVEEVRLLEEVGGNLARGLTALRARAGRRQVEKKLHESEELYRTLIENINDFIFGLDTEGLFTYASPAIGQLAHYRPEEVVGRHYSVFVYPDDLADLKANFERTLAGHLEPHECRLLDKKGAIHHVRVSSRLLVEEEKVMGVLGIMTDITNRKTAELEQQQLMARLQRRSIQLQTAAEVSRAVSLMLDPDELLPQVAELICNRFNLYYVGIFLVEQEQASEPGSPPRRYAVLRAGTGEAGQKMLAAGHRLEVGGASMIGWCVAHAQGRIALDVGKDAVHFDNPALPATRSELALPLASRGQVIGAMTVQSAQEAAFSDEDITTLQTMADQVANAIENARLFQEIQASVEQQAHTHMALQESEARYRLLVELSPDSIAISSEGKILFINPAGARLLGADRPEQLVGKPVQDFYPPGGWEDSLERFMSLVEREEVLPVKQRFVRLDGATVDLEVLATPFTYQGKPAVQVVGHDLTERERAAEALRRRDAILEAVEFAAEQFLKAPTWEQNIQDVLGRLGDATQASRVYIFKKRADPADEALISRLYEWVAPGVAPQIDNLALQDLPLRAGGLARWQDLLSQGDIIHGCVNQFPETEQAVLAPQAIQSLVAVPVFVGQAWWGMIGLDDCVAGHEWSEVEVDALKAAADILGAAIQREQAEESAHHRARYLSTLNNIGQAISSTLDLDIVLTTLLENVRQVTDAEACSVALAEDNGDLVFYRAVGAGSQQVIGLHLKPGQGIAGWVAAHRQSVLAPDVASDPRFSNGWNQQLGFVTRNMVCVPLIARNVVIGVVELLNKRRGTLDEGDVRLLESVAAQAAIAITNARLFQAERQQRELAQTLREVGETLTATLDTDMVLNRLLEHVSRVVSNDSANVMLVEGGRARVARGRGYERFGVQELVAALEFSIATTPNLKEMAETHLPLVISDIASYPGWIMIPGMEWQRSCASAPILIRGEVSGFLNVDSTTPGFFTPSHAERLGAFAGQAAVALYNARLFEAERRRSAELEILRQASLRLTSQFELQVVFETVIHHLLKLVPADDAHIFLYQDGQLTFGAAMWAGQYQKRPLAEPRPEGLTYTVARTGERIVVSDVTTHSLFQDRMPGGGAIIGLPLRSGDQVRGVLTVAFESPHSFDENELRVLELLADQAAVAIQNARLFEEARRRLDEMAAMSEVALGGAAGRPFDEIVSRATEAMDRLWPNANVGFLFVDGADRSLRRHVSYKGVPPETVSDLRIPLYEGLTGWAVQERQPVRVGNVEADPRYISAMPGICSEMVAPLVVGGRAFGVVNVESPRLNAFSEDDLRLLTTLAGQLATVFEKARLDAAVEHASTLAKYATQLEQRVEERTAEIRSQEARTRAILDALGEGVVVTDVDGEILYVNPALEAMTGYSAADASGQNPRIWQGGRTPIDIYRGLWGAIVQGKTWRGELINRRKDGTFYDASVTIAPIFQADLERLVGFVGVQHDITRLKELDRLKSKFVANVSHELRTPLSNIKLYASLLEMGKPENRSQYLDVLKREELRLEHLIEGLLMLSRIDLAKVQVRRMPLDVDALARQLVADRQALAASKGLTLEHETQAEPLPKVLADEAMLSQVLTNLMSNAMNYTLEGGKVTVRTETQRAAGEVSEVWVTLTVRDTGVGVSPADLEHLFERFYRGQAANQTGAPGTGLGLAICEEIISRHEGRITVESELGQGSAFTVWLPAA